MNDGTAALTGWYGKLASLGDFAGRRLPPAFIARWDDWLQEVIAGSRAELGAGWLEAYLGAPVWRFLFWPPAPEDDGDDDASPDPQAPAALYAGVLMPSVDHVGRYFPLCVAAALPGLPLGEAEWAALSVWMDTIEDAVLATLDTRRSVQQFDETLLALPPPWPGLRPDGPAAALMLLGAQSLAGSAQGASLWWTGSAHGADRPLFACPGLPDAARYAAMLRAAPAGRGE